MFRTLLGSAHCVGEVTDRVRCRCSHSSRTRGTRTSCRAYCTSSGCAYARYTDYVCELCYVLCPSNEHPEYAGNKT